MITHLIVDPETTRKLVAKMMENLKAEESEQKV